VTPTSWPAVQAAVESGLVAIDAIVDEEEPISFVFCNIRPPGHHSGHSHAWGFCVFNQAVITAFYALTKYPSTFHKVAIIDWDLHAGDKTVQLLRRPANAHYAIEYYSLHQVNVFPNERQFNQRRRDKGRIHLRALKAGCTWEEYYEAFDELQTLMIAQAPDLIIVSCGFDSCKGDQLGDLPLKPQHFGVMTYSLMENVCPRVVSLLEGGYNLDSISKCLRLHLDAAEQYADIHGESADSDEVSSSSASSSSSSGTSSSSEEGDES
jgi:acetoin utilization deacetylase AcuC-like enzyme